MPPDPWDDDMLYDDRNDHLHEQPEDEDAPLHQSQRAPEENKFHKGNGADGKHYWLTPWEAPEFVALVKELGPFDFDPCPYPRPTGFDGITCEWGQINYVNPPFGSYRIPKIDPKTGKQKVNKSGKRKGLLVWDKIGPTAWMRKAIKESEKGKRVVLVFPVDKWVLMMTKACGAGDRIRNLGDVRWLATEDGSTGDGTGRHIAAFILGPLP